MTRYKFRISNEARQSMPFIPATPALQGLVGAVRSGGGDCLTESGIVWLSVAFRLWQGRPFRHATENHYEAPEGVSAQPERTAPIRPFSRQHQPEKNMSSKTQPGRPACAEVTSELVEDILFALQHNIPTSVCNWITLSPRHASAPRPGRGGPFGGRRLSDRVGHRLVIRRLSPVARPPVPARDGEPLRGPRGSFGAPGTDRPDQAVLPYCPRLRDASVFISPLGSPTVQWTGKRSL